MKDQQPLVCWAHGDCGCIQQGKSIVTVASLPPVATCLATGTWFWCQSAALFERLEPELQHSVRTYLPNDLMQYRPSWEGYPKNSAPYMEQECSLPCSQEPDTGHYLSQMNPVHTLTHFPKINFNIIRPFKPLSSQWYLPSGFPKYFPKDRNLMRSQMTSPQK
jgi:hypothetical protein